MKKSILAIWIGLLIWGGIAEGGEITGTVQNGTAGFSVPRSLAVQLNRYKNGQQDNRFQPKTTIRGRNTFVFKNLPEDSDYVYEPMVYYQGVKYYGEAKKLSPQMPAAESHVLIYETSRSDSAVSALIHHLFIRPAIGFIQVNEMLVLKNRSDRTYIGPPVQGEKFHTLNYRLPPDAANVQLGKGLMSCCIVFVPGGFYDTMELLPGKKEIYFSYIIKTPKKELDLIKPLTISTAVFDVFTDDPNIQLSGEGFSEIPVKGSKFRRFEARDFKPGQKIRLHITGLQGKPTDIGTILMIVFIAVLLFIVILVAKRIKRDKTLSVPSSPQKDPSVSDYFLRQIAELDEAFANQKLEESDYREKRKELLTMLEKLEKK
ncbi:MAG: hypothetical protein GXO76_10140 [Calditrichaeota bacterium]|nr:hypothetical protein [Calditrichota bacterium]